MLVYSVSTYNYVLIINYKQLQKNIKNDKTTHKKQTKEPRY